MGIKVTWGTGSGFTPVVVFGLRWGLPAHCSGFSLSPRHVPAARRLTPGPRMQGRAGRRIGGRLAMVRAYDGACLRWCVLAMVGSLDHRSALRVSPMQRFRAASSGSRGAFLPGGPGRWGTGQRPREPRLCPSRRHTRNGCVPLTSSRQVGGFEIGGFEIDG